MVARVIIHGLSSELHFKGVDQQKKVGDLTVVTQIVCIWPDVDGGANVLLPTNRRTPGCLYVARAEVACSISGMRGGDCSDRWFWIVWRRPFGRLK